MESVLVAAKKYHSMGLATIPVPFRSKNPNRQGWQNERHAEKQISSVFNEPTNIGVILGEASGGLVDVDVDAPEALDCVLEFLPDTEWMHGRHSKPSSHWFYRIAGAGAGGNTSPQSLTPSPRTQRFQDVDGTTLLELRGEGGQTVIPPSAHPSGEEVVFFREGAPAIVELQKLQEAVGCAAAVSLLARHWPQKGSRHDVTLAIAGFMLRGGMNETTVTRVVSLAARTAGDEEWRDRRWDVRSTAKRLQQGESVVGGPTAAELLGDKVVQKLSDWLRLRVSGIRSQVSGGLSVPQTLAPSPQRLAPIDGAELQARGNDMASLEFLPVLGQNPPVLVKGWSHMLSAYPKTGKTELMCRLVSEWGASGLRVAYFTEEPQSVWIARLQSLGAVIRNVSFLFALGYSQESLMHSIQNGGEDVVVVDTIRLLGLRDEKDNAQIHIALAPLVAGCRALGKTLVLVHHNRKAGGEYGEAASGGHAFLGIVDIALELKRDSHSPKRRLIRGLGRVVDIPDLMYELRDDGGFFLLGDPHQVEMQHLKERLLDVLTDDWQTIKEILDTMEEPKPSSMQVRRVLSDLSEDEIIERNPPLDEGVRPGKVYRWRLIANQHSNLTLPI